MDHCLFCSSPLLPGSRRRYCSDLCRQAAWRLRKKKRSQAALSSLFFELRRVESVQLRSDLYDRVKALGLVL